MKKLSILFVAAVLVFSIAGHASAAFEFGDFLVMTYGSDVELATNMGDALTNGTATDLYNTDLSTFTGAQTFADLSIGAFAGLVSGTMLERYDMWFAVEKGAVPVIKPAQVYSFTGANENIITRYNSTGVAGDYQDLTLSTGDSSSFSVKMNTTEGWYNNFNDINFAAGTIDLAPLDVGAGSFVEMDIYHFYSDNWGGSIETSGDVGDLIYGIDCNGDVYAQVSAVPVPASVLLLGSGILGLFGIRRKRS